MSKTPEDVNLFVLAHPDDEIVFSCLLERLVKNREAIRLIYLTDGAGRGSSVEVRKAESLRALQKLGIEPSWVSFAGADKGIPDGELYRHLDEALDAVTERAEIWHSIRNVYSLAWEGGHPDHDGALVVAAAFAASRDLSDRVWQVAFYRASDRLPPPLFALCSPLPANGAVRTLPFSILERLTSVTMMRFYPSQWRSFVGLAPAILWHWLTGRFGLQKLSFDRLFERPSSRPLLYERRNEITFEEFATAAVPFLKANLVGDAQVPGPPAAAHSA